MLVLMKNPPLDPSALGSDGLPFRRRVVVRLEMAAWRGRQREESSQSERACMSMCGRKTNSGAASCVANNDSCKQGRYLGVWGKGV